MKYRKWKIITGAVLLTVGQMASAASVNLVSESRFIKSSGNAGAAYAVTSWAEESRVDGEFDEFSDLLEETATVSGNVSTATAELQSNISALSYTAIGNAYALMDLGGPGSFYTGINKANSESVYDVSFELLEPMNFELSGFVALVLNSEGLEKNPLGSAKVSLTQSESNFEQIFGGTGLDADFFEDISVAGILLAGNYRLRVEAAASSNGGGYVGVEEALGRYAVQLNLTPVPVPASVWLFCSALGFLGWKSRKQK
jgi:hypothetical protein